LQCIYVYGNDYIYKYVRLLTPKRAFRNLASFVFYINIFKYIYLYKLMYIGKMSSNGRDEIGSNRVAVKFLLSNGLTGSLIGSGGSAIKELVCF
jgi:hypothetical protein